MKIIKINAVGASFASFLRGYEFNSMGLMKIGLSYFDINETFGNVGLRVTLNL